MKEPALDPDAGHAAPNELVLTFYDDQHLDVFGEPSMRRPMAPTEKKLPGWYCFSPALQPRFTFRGSNVVAIPETAWKEVGFLATIRVRGSEVVSRDFDLTCGPSSAASRWVFMGDQRTGLWASRALWPARSMSPPLGGQKRGHVRHRGAQDRRKIRNASRATRVR